jgi:hypothetical protein
MGKRSAAGAGHQKTGGKVQLLDALPPRFLIKYDISVLGSFYLDATDQERLVAERFASIASHRKFVGEFDLQPKHEIHPERFVPGHQFRASLGPLGRRLSSRDAMPYQQVLEGIDNPIEVIPRIDRFGKNVLVVAVRYHGTYGVSNLEGLLSAQARVVNAVVAAAEPSMLRQMAAVAAGVPANAMVGLPKRRVHSHAVVTDERDASSLDRRLAEFLASNRRAVVALHISKDPTKVPDARLESALVAANAELNLKSESQLLLINAQGSTLIAGSSPGGVSPGTAHHNRHARVVDLSEIATAMQHMLLRGRSRDDLDARSWGGDSYAIDRWVRFPKNVLSTSVSNQKVWSVLSDSYVLPDLLTEFSAYDVRDQHGDQAVGV